MDSLLLSAPRSGLPNSTCSFGLRDLKQRFTEDGDSAYVYQRRFRTLTALTTSDRYIVNKIAANQAAIEVAYATAHALADLGRMDEARRHAELARSPADTLLGDVRALVLAQNNRSLSRANELRRNAGHRRSVLWLLFLVSLTAGIGISVFTVRMVDRPLRRLISAADRFGAGDLRRVQLGRMPTELDLLARAMDGMASRLRGVVVSVVGEASQIGNSATDFSAMSEELAASSGEISTAMVKVASSAEQQVKGMEKADALLLSLRQIAETNAASLCPRTGARRAHPTAGGAQSGRRGSRRTNAAGHPRSRRHLGASGAGARPALRTDHGFHRSHPSDLNPNEPPGAERRHRGGSRRGAWTRLRRGCRGGTETGRLELKRRRGGCQDGPVHSKPGAGCLGNDGCRVGEGLRHRNGGASRLHELWRISLRR